MRNSNLSACQVWYFAQPFRHTGPLVLLIDHVAKDCMYFIGLASIVLFGFALALHVLFRDVNHSLSADIKIQRMPNPGF